MAFTVLTDDQIRSLLENLTAPELEDFRRALAFALHEHSTGSRGETSSIHQPERTSVHSAATGATTLFMPSCSPAGNAVKVITLSSAANQVLQTDTTNAAKPVIPPTGAITLFTSQGAPLGLLHASTLTAFRTALASLCLVRRRRCPAAPRPAVVMAVFGCGEQAYWHVRLTLLARGADVKKVVFVNRRVSPSCGAMEEKLGEVLREADVVFCCTPSTEPLFDGAVLASEAGRNKPRLVVAIGSYTPGMREIPGKLIRQAVAGEEQEAGVVVVDTIDGALKEAGELIEAGVKPEQLVELGELVMLGETAPSRGSEDAGAKRREQLAEWLQTGNVVYKSVGMGLMDLSIGMHMVKYAQEKGVGTHIQGF